VSRIGPTLVALALAAPGLLPAQTVRLAAFGAAATNSEVDGTREAKGLGFGAAARVEHSRFRLDASVLHAALRADFAIQPDYDVNQVEVAATYFWRPYLAAQVGLARRFIRPDLVAQDVGLVRIGVLSEVRLARLAGLWVRGAYLPVSRFSGGGSASFGMEVGFGAEVGRPEARMQGYAEFDYQRIDRNAAAVAPLQFSAGRLGVRVRL
jgi:hypothetical protein